jgi:hypothetical protein
VKKQNSKLFAKFEDVKIVEETAQKINGGKGKDVPPDNSTATGDHDCSLPDSGVGADCGDAYNGPKTATNVDTVATLTYQDQCQ